MNMETSQYKGIPAMSPPVVHEYLHELGSNWTGAGMAMELGCWLGATSVPLLEGLVSVWYDKPFYAFDKWRANEEQAIKAESQGHPLSNGQDIMPVYMNNVSAVYDDVRPVKGNIPDTLQQIKMEPIEICIFDAPKQDPIFIDSMKRLEPYFIPGVTVLGLLDYYSYSKNKGHRAEILRAPVNFMEKYGSCFTKIAEWPTECSCAFFKYEKPISWK